MSARSFFRSAKQASVVEIAELTGAKLHRAGDPARRITSVAALDRAGPSDLAFLDNPRFSRQARDCAAGACLTTDRFASDVAVGTAILVVKEPFRAFVEVARALFPGSLRPSSLCDAAGVAPGATLHPSARMETGVTVEPGAVIGAGVEIGSGTVIGANAVIGTNVRIGRECVIGANAVIAHAYIGDRVLIHPGCQVGQDGFGFVMGPAGHRKIPQIGRVIIQDDVEIGAGTAIDRGALRDTVIGEGTKIDNHVQVGHNVTIGRHCVLVAQAGVGGSTTLEDFVVLGARVGVKDNVTIGEGAQVGANSGVGTDIPAGERWIGYPAKPATLWMREMRFLNRMTRTAERTGRNDE
jgi:UDP-3-O-[3-hydroxymyristoyl] glucosamine N-acyltransferase